MLRRTALAAVLVAIAAVPAGASSTEDYPLVTKFVQVPSGAYQVADRPGNPFIRYVVIHDTELTYPGTVAVFTDPDACCSVHYLVDGEAGAKYPPVTQFVHDRDIAYHAGNFWFNQHSVGIEHDGFADGPIGFYTETMYQRSAKLAGWLAATYHIPIDRAHFLSHANLPAPLQSLTSTMHWDPGPFWDWPHYLKLVRAQYRNWAGHAQPPPPAVPKRFRKTRDSIRTISVGSAYDRALDVNDWSSGRHVEFANVFQSPKGELVLGASNATSWRSPKEYNARDFVCDNVPEATTAGGMDQLSDQRAKADWGEAFVRIASKKFRGVRFDRIWFNGVKGWVRHTRTTAGWGIIVTLKAPGALYGKPVLGPSAQICPLPANRAGQSYVAQNVYVDGTAHLTWYEIYYNHRVAWVPAAAVTVR